MEREKEGNRKSRRKGRKGSAVEKEGKIEN